MALKKVMDFINYKLYNIDGEIRTKLQFSVRAHVYLITWHMTL